ncbi:MULTISPECIES: hypothetical protein [Microbacterium]|uniref:hypothetical protein n=1 Tax=Microbacterium TaxID=33882 RepID=UPI001EF6ED6E|nr:hypothetical protein [Microbacterium aurum]MCG7413458.1 hypothetical protein [Microbacterium aurum]
MSHWQSASPEFNARLQELAALFYACREAFHATADSYHWSPAKGSPAADDAIALPSPDPLISDRDGETGHRLIAGVVQTFLLTASGHFGGLASLYTSGEVLFSPPLLIRAIIENCAHAVWVLGEEGDHPENRLARGYLEEFISAEEAKKNAGHMHGRAHASHVHSAESYGRLKRQILARFDDASKEALGRKELHGETLPSPADAVKWMYALTEAAGGTVTQEQASGVYGFLSNMTHPTLYPARQRRGWYSDPDHGHRVAFLHVEMGSVEGEARAALAAFYNALNYTTSYFGWPTTVVDSLQTKIEGVIPTFFR